MTHHHHHALLLLLSLLLPLISTAIEFVTTAPKHSCATLGAKSVPFTPTPLPLISTLYDDVTLLLAPVRSDDDDGSGGNGANQMCILSSWTTTLTDKTDNGNGYYVPLGRSADNEDWVRPPGNKGRFVSYECGTATNSGTYFTTGEYLCQVTLPMTSTVRPNGSLDELDVPYYLTYYERSLTVRNELSRFLQRTTFGPTSSELDSLELAYVALGGSGGGPDEDSTITHTNVMEQLQTEWIQSQQDPTTFSTGQFSSLREYYRKRLNPRSPEVYRIGESGPHPCERFSRWRKFAFTAYDVINSQYLRWGNNALGGGFYQQQVPHKVTVETIKLMDIPTGVPTGSPVGVPTASPSWGDAARSFSPVSRRVCRLLGLWMWSLMCKGSCVECFVSVCYCYFSYTLVHTHHSVCLLLLLLIHPCLYSLILFVAL